MPVEQEITQALTVAFAPTRLEVVNDSHRHAGHSGDDGSGESHFTVLMRARDLTPLSRIARHRAVHKALGPDLVGRIHALALDLG